MQQLIWELYKKNGKTIAVLGNGFNYIYPEEHEWLFHKILVNGGCIITQYAPNVEINMQNFPKRNQIISGISDSVLVVEAHHRSGSSITAQYAKEQGKSVYAIPSNIDSANGIGTNRLIREKKAEIVTKPSQIEKQFLFSTSIDNDSKESKRNEKEMYHDIPEEYMPVYTLLEKEPMYINEMAKQLKQSISELSGTITMMEIEGFVIKLDSNQYKRKE